MALVGPPEMLLIAAAALALIVGPRKLPELAGALGKSKKEYKKSMQEAEEIGQDVTPDVEKEMEDLNN
jgi:TatA/E family protein of Tat protein translocase